MDAGSGHATVKAYREAVNSHDAEAALGYLCDDFRLEFAGGPELTKAALADAIGWDVGTRGRLDWRVVSSGPGGIVVEGEETNAFLRLLGLGPLRFRSTFRVDPRGCIAAQRYEALSSEESVDEALRPVIAWAERHAPEELARLYPEGRLTYSERSGRGWVALLRRWRAAEDA